MYCDKCKVNITYTTDTCPLCRGRISDTLELSSPNYPRRDSKFRFPLKYSFSRLYLTIAIFLYALMLILDLFISPNYGWSHIAGICLLYAYVLIRHTIIANEGSAGKILLQGIMVGFIVLVVQYFFHDRGNWGFNYVLPVILMGNCVGLWLASIIRKVRYGSYSFFLLIAGLLALLPLLWYDLGISNIVWLAITCAVVGGLTIILVLSIFGKRVWNELKKIIHI